MAAEARAGNRNPWPGGRNDVAIVRKAIRAEVYDETGIEPALNLTWQAACAFVSDDDAWKVIEMVAAFLVLRGEMNRQSIEDVAGHSCRVLPPLPVPEWELPLWAAARMRAAREKDTGWCAWLAQFLR
jgi:hypothetical protein